MESVEESNKLDERAARALELLEQCAKFAPPYLRGEIYQLIRDAAGALLPHVPADPAAGLVPLHVPVAPSRPIEPGVIVGDGGIPIGNERPPTPPLSAVLPHPLARLRSVGSELGPEVIAALLLRVVDGPQRGISQEVLMRAVVDARKAYEPGGRVT